MSEPVKPTVWETEKISGPKKFRHVLTFENNDPCFGVDFSRRASPWIPVSERLPEIGQEVLVWPGPSIATWASGEEWEDAHGSLPKRAFSHWMPIEGPEGSK